MFLSALDDGLAESNEARRKKMTLVFGGVLLALLVFGGIAAKKGWK